MSAAAAVDHPPFVTASERDQFYLRDGTCGHVGGQGQQFAYIALRRCVFPAFASLVLENLQRQRLLSAWKTETSLQLVVLLVGAGVRRVHVEQQEGSARTSAGEPSNPRRDPVHVLRRQALASEEVGED